MALFQKVASLATRPFPGEGAEQIKIGDFNGDGYADFVVARIHWWSVGETASQFQVYLGNGKGGFTDQTDSLFTSGTPFINYVPRFIVADFNGDKVDDLFAIDNGIDKPPFSGGQNKLFLSSHGKLVDATANLPQGLKNNHGAVAGDIDNDGDLDILVNALMNDGSDLQLNNGSGVFTSANHLMPNLTMTGPGGGSMVRTSTWSGLIDVNNDGWVDMILGAWDGIPNALQRSELYLNREGSFAGSPVRYLPDSGVHAPIVLDVKELDLNGDDLPDLVLSITNGGDWDLFYNLPYLQFLVNKGDGVFVDDTAARYAQSKAPLEHKSWYKSVEVIDLNRDGYDDLFLDNFHVGPTVLLNNGHGQFYKEAKLPAGSSESVEIYVVAGVGDLNGDGMPDLVMSTDVGAASGFDIYLNQTQAPTGLGRLDGPYDNSAIYRFFNSATGAHFYSANKSEVETVLLNYPSFNFEGRAFKQNVTGIDVTDVFRFFNTETGTHFFTADAAEATHVRSTYASFQDEGIAYQAHAEQSAGTTALYRFFNAHTGTHFYTANQAEMESVRIEFAGMMNYEGVAYYVAI